VPTKSSSLLQLVKNTIEIITTNELLKQFRGYVRKFIKNQGGIVINKERPLYIQLIEDIETYQYQLRIVLLSLDHGILVEYRDPDNYRFNLSPDQHALYTKCKEFVAIELTKFGLSHYNSFMFDKEIRENKTETVVISSDGIITIQSRKDILDDFINEFNISSHNNKPLGENTELEYQPVIQIVKE